MHLLPRLVTLDSYSRSFQYKILNNVLYFKKKLITFRKPTSPLCPFCKLSDETVLRLFYECNIILNLWSEQDLFFENEFTLFDPTQQAAFLVFLNVNSKLLLLQNDLLLIFKIYIYNSGRVEPLKTKSLIREITNIKNIEEKISFNPTRPGRFWPSVAWGGPSRPAPYKIKTANDRLMKLGTHIVWTFVYLLIYFL